MRYTLHIWRAINTPFFIGYWPLRFFRCAPVSLKETVAVGPSGRHLEENASVKNVRNGGFWVQKSFFSKSAYDFVSWFLSLTFLACGRIGILAGLVCLCLCSDKKKVFFDFMTVRCRFSPDSSSSARFNYYWVIIESYYRVIIGEGESSTWPPIL